MIQHYRQALQEVIKIQAQIQDIHPLLGKLMPVAIVEGDCFLIYDYIPGEESYTFIKQAPTPMPVPVGIRAAFPLDCYAGKAACVVTGEVFDSVEGTITIFHEFVHCQQYETCEIRLKEMLEIAQKAQTENDFMWELNYPFPYQAAGFINSYTAFFQSMDTEDREGVVNWRQTLKRTLHRGDYEYMVWQEWKEGFARHVENLIRNRLGFEENHNGRTLPYSRVTFYEGGSNLIAFLRQRDAGLINNLESMFNFMFALS